MDGEPAEPRRFPRALLVGLLSIGAILVTGLVGWVLWLVSRTSLAPQGQQGQPVPEPPDDGDGDGGGGGTAQPSTAAPNDAATAQGTHDGADGGDTDASCDDSASCEAPTCDAPTCDTGGSCDAGSGSGLVSAGASLMSVLPLVTVARLTPRRALRQRDRASIPARCGLAAIRGYRRHIAPRTRTRCRFRPSCSRYGSRMIADYGLAEGSRLTLRRIGRCTRSVPMGTPDPPP